MICLFESGAFVLTENSQVSADSMIALEPHHSCVQYDII